MIIKNKKRYILFLTIMFVMIMFLTTFENAVFAQERVIYYGSDPDAVGKVQRNLKDWGYYDYNIDGHFGWRTEEAVKSFQRKHGLTPDGVCGSKTLEALGLSNLISSPAKKTTNRTQTAGGTRSEAYLLAQCINGEARGEPYEGQVAVAAVILNRVKNASFPNSISGVIYQPGAFDAVSDGQIYLEPRQSSIKAANDAMAGWDPSGGAIYYYNPVTSTNQWILSRPIINRIGKHVFCK
ncbi:spore cortex-lytic enzyme [Alkalibaculum sp. M08DMB]|uniref:Spore cortex-lytic enzyme n=1 Tax=Alkalibaculum sporogenes TaxID=2655001 RepID=A0A6A7K5R8_9FIRM|nr:spore cortex-lytic enzyme [Alkalibaculum sporogenes]MPW24750.1 spore cortex-lytic enzyme [Alkalibaculum sporogenes]